jgi:hypothetical protein
MNDCGIGPSYFSRSIKPRPNCLPTESKPKLYDAGNFYEHFSRSCAALVTYGRCFADTAPGMVSLDGKDVLSERSADERTDIRDSYIPHIAAHAGYLLNKLTIADDWRTFAGYALGSANVVGRTRPALVRPRPVCYSDKARD